MIRNSIFIMFICFINLCFGQLPQNITLTAKTISVGTTDNYEAEQTIVSPVGTSFIVEGECELKAGVEILLEDGFEIKPNAVFCAIIENANNMVITNHFYYVLTDEITNTYFSTTSSGVLNFQFIEEYDIPQNSTLNYKIFDSHNTDLAVSIDVNIRKGKNLVQLDLSSLSLCLATYRLEVINSKGEKFYANFKYDDASAGSCPIEIIDNI